MQIAEYVMKFKIILFWCSISAYKYIIDETNPKNILLNVNVSQRKNVYLKCLQLLYYKEVLETCIYTFNQLNLFCDLLK